MINLIHGTKSFERTSSPLAFVPTMGNLHAGHLSLIQKAAQFSDQIVVSIFVNPTQFGEGEDFASYPRTLEQDLEKIKSLQIPITVYAPETKDLYGDNLVKEYKAGPLGDMLEGNIRPGHFDGMITVVHKLFDKLKPDHAFFGKKDYQQLKIIEQHSAKHFGALQIHACDIVREPSGLALSSRNGYLNLEQTEEALTLYRTLSYIEKLIVTQKDLRLAQAEIQSILNQDPRFNYLSIRTQEDLTPPLNLKSPLVILGNFQIENTRLLDNIEVFL